MASVQVQSGDTCFLWHDSWGGTTLSLTMPHLFSFAKSKNVSVLKARSVPDVNQLFQLPLSQEAFDQLLALAQLLDELPDSDQSDAWTYSWGSPLFAPTKAYKHLIGTRQVHISFTWLWKCSTQKKHKAFFWLLLNDRLSTRNLLKRKNRVLPSYDCVLCHFLVEETLDHLFWAVVLPRAAGPLFIYSCTQVTLSQPWSPSKIS
jgi:hypothetical protein